MWTRRARGIRRIAVENRSPRRNTLQVAGSDRAIRVNGAQGHTFSVAERLSGKAINRQGTSGETPESAATKVASKEARMKLLSLIRSIGFWLAQSLIENPATGAVATEEQPFVQQ